MTLIIPYSQFDAPKYARFNLERVFQCSDIMTLDADIEAVRRGLEEEIRFQNKRVKLEEAKVIFFGPVVTGDATAVTDHFDVFQYYRLVQETV